MLITASRKYYVHAQRLYIVFFQSIFMSRSEIEGFLSTGTLTLHNVSFSQYDESASNSDQVKYVQDSMRKHWEVLGQWIMEENASVFVCG